MQEYRICVRDSSGQIIRQEVWECDGESEALDYGRQLASRCTVEVWDSALCLQSLELGASRRDWVR